MKTYQEVADAIQTKYSLVNKPSLEEVSKILNLVSESTTEEELASIIFDVLSDTSCWGLEHLDMSASKSILLQIKNASKKPKENGSN
ncbi:TPA: hypothetical protein ACVOYV_004230 [Vibrio diabolicus]|uniref:hypothetical protein n=1 Tax=Vibrio parahaemolyticus TaxID=670 RepID=UPI00084BB72C|nr:hypothetical protein [Vibrio parahaemolyticus]ODZ31457.1 hypothetical protein BBM38_18695 [Vibrio parahaemolyticus]ODZ35218.1 hypothetical protein BBM37_11535 [Vibrio parahaemolyticus]OHX52604.1 hypothetical protein BBZ60_23035 [Vibrio parahaemolyticus]